MDEIIREIGERHCTIASEALNPEVYEQFRGQLVKATVVLTAGWAASDELRHELQEYVKMHTALYKYPRVLDFVPELPKTISGKIRRVTIRQAGCQAAAGDRPGAGQTGEVAED